MEGCLSKPSYIEDNTRAALAWNTQRAIRRATEPLCLILFGGFCCRYCTSSWNTRSLSDLTLVGYAEKQWHESKWLEMHLKPGVDWRFAGCTTASCGKHLVEEVFTRARTVPWCIDSRSRRKTKNWSIVWVRLDDASVIIVRERD